MLVNKNLSHLISVVETIIHEPGNYWRLPNCNKHVTSIQHILKRPIFYTQHYAHNKCVAFYILHATPCTNTKPNPNSNPIPSPYLVLPDHIAKFIVTSNYLRQICRRIGAQPTSRDLTNAAWLKPIRLHCSYKISAALYTFCQASGFETGST